MTVGLIINSLTYQAPPEEICLKSYTRETAPYEIPIPEKVEVRKVVSITPSIVVSKFSSPLGTNCVAYAKSKGHVPMGVGTLNQKVAHIKSYKPKPGKIGVTAEGPIGHLVYVEEVKKDTVVISEGNFIHGFVSFREVPKSKIIGYL